jgi:hypothetical protein
VSSLTTYDSAEPGGGSLRQQYLVPDSSVGDSFVRDLTLVRETNLCDFLVAAHKLPVPFQPSSLASPSISSRGSDLNESEAGGNSTSLTVGGGGLKANKTKQLSTSSLGAGSDTRKKSSWYNAFNPNYKRRSDDFKKTFPTLPSDERLVVGAS